MRAASVICYLLVLLTAPVFLAVQLAVGEWLMSVVLAVPLLGSLAGIWSQTGPYRRTVDYAQLRAIHAFLTSTGADVRAVLEGRAEPPSELTQAKARIAELEAKVYRAKRLAEHWRSLGAAGFGHPSGPEQRDYCADELTALLNELEGPGNA